MNKIQVRKKFIEKRRNLGKKERQKFNLLIKQNFFNQAFMKKKLNFLLYHSMHDEVDTKQIIIELLEKNYTVSLPISKTNVEEIECRQITNLSRDVKPGAYGIMEPFEHLQIVNNKKIDIVVIPGVAFDEYGNRLGFGKGYYDKFLAKNMHMLKVALSYEVQISRDKLPVDIHDIKMDYIITENRILRQ